MIFNETINHIHHFYQKNLILAPKNDSYSGFFENFFNSSDPNIPQKRLEHLEKPLRPYLEPLDVSQHL
jgi:hypothetical protein